MYSHIYQGMPDTGSGEGNTTFCWSCGVAIEERSTYCPECGKEQEKAEVERKSQGREMQGPTEVDYLAAIGIGSTVIAAFLQWAGNPLVSITGFDTGGGIITILLALLAGISVKSKDNWVVELVALIAGIGIIVTAFHYIGEISSIRSSSVGGGLFLTLAGGLIVAINAGNRLHQNSEDIREFADSAPISAIQFLFALGLILSVMVGGWGYGRVQAMNDVQLDEGGVDFNTYYGGGNSTEEAIIVHVVNADDSEIRVGISGRVEYRGETYTGYINRVLPSGSSMNYVILLNDFASINVNSSDRLSFQGAGVDYHRCKNWRGDDHRISCNYDEFNISVEIRPIA